MPLISRANVSPLPILAFFLATQLAACGQEPSSETLAKSKNSLKITTFNTLNYGRADYGKEFNDERDPVLRKFFEKNLRDSDVLVVQEVLEKKRFQEKIIKKDHTCHSYNRFANHQYVMICVKNNGLSFVPYEDKDFDIESVGVDGLRPAVHGAVVSKSGKKILEVFGLHLKASPKFSGTRLEQIKSLSEEITSRKNPLPVVITGDLNTSGNDLQKMSDLFKENDIDLKLLKNPHATFNDDGFKKNFDHFFVSKSLNTPKNTKVFSSCGYKNYSGYTLSDYNYWISDHCPVSTSISL